MKFSTRGVLAAIAAFVLWGLTPIYWSWVGDVTSYEVILHRIWWSFPLLWGILLIRAKRRDAGGGHTNGSFGALIPGWRVLVTTTIAGVLVSANWFTYVWAVTHGHTLDASLGYYINPLVSVALGTIVLRERLTRLQAAAVVVAATGVLYLTVKLGSVPWISLILALTFGTYGLIKKRVSVGATHSLALELIPLAPPALVLIIVGMANGSSAMVGGDPVTVLLLIGAGAVTVVPLVLFGYAAQTIRLSDVGFVQYIAPTFMLLIGVFLLGEVFDLNRLPGFIMVWVALGLYTASSLVSRRQPA